MSDLPSSPNLPTAPPPTPVLTHLRTIHFLGEECGPSAGAPPTKVYYNGTDTNTDTGSASERAHPNPLPPLPEGAQFLPPAGNPKPKKRERPGAIRNLNIRTGRNAPSRAAAPDTSGIGAIETPQFPRTPGLVLSIPLYVIFSEAESPRLVKDGKLRHWQLEWEVSHPPPNSREDCAASAAASSTGVVEAEQEGDISRCSIHVFLGGPCSGTELEEILEVPEPDLERVNAQVGEKGGEKGGGVGAITVDGPSSLAILLTSLQPYFIDSSPLVPQSRFRFPRHHSLSKPSPSTGGPGPGSDFAPLSPSTSSGSSRSNETKETITGQISLTRPLAAHLSKGTGDALESSIVIPYLRKNLRWIIQAADGEVPRKIPSTLGLKMRVATTVIDMEVPRKQNYTYFESIWEKGGVGRIL